MVKIFALVMFIFGGINECFAKNPENLGLKSNLLQPCPRSPNCVLSLSTNPIHQIKPIDYSDPLQLVKERVKKAISAAGDINFVTENHFYWHIEFFSRWIGFVDDVEIYFDENKSLIHVRSASRLGYWDFGVNRRRVEKIRFYFEKLTNAN